MRMMRAFVLMVLEQDNANVRAQTKRLVDVMAALVAKQQGGTFDPGASDVIARLDRMFEEELQRE